MAESDYAKGLPESVRRNFSFDPTLLAGGSQAVEKNEQIYAGADEYMRAHHDSSEEEDIGESSLSQELAQMVRERNKAAVPLAAASLILGGDSHCCSLFALCLSCCLLIRAC